MMNTMYTRAFTSILLLLSVSIAAFAFAPTPPTKLSSSTTALSGGYVPDGLTPEEYGRIKRKDKKRIGKDLGRLGPRGFKSRSMQAWQEAYERGEAGHSFAPFGYRQQLKQGKISKKDVPYMVRGGSWDDSDIFGMFGRLKWNKTDKEYANGGTRRSSRHPYLDLVQASTGLARSVTQGTI